MTRLLGKPSDGLSWYLIHCQVRKEVFAANNLRNQLGISVFLPELKVHSRKETRYVPFFPGYIFAHVDLQKAPLSHINTTLGVIRLVEFGGDPQPIPHDVIETITMQLERLNSSHCTPQNFAPGDFVRVKHGPLQDLEMIFLGPSRPDQRAHVLLRFLGRLKEVHVDVEILEKVPGKLPVQQDMHLIRERYLQRTGHKVAH
jgi:transcriptional antiterminator RfaH